MAKGKKKTDESNQYSAKKLEIKNIKQTKKLSDKSKTAVESRLCR
jgi:hypothetical protein